jgi:hypothetical protein
MSCLSEPVMRNPRNDPTLCGGLRTHDRPTSLQT